MEIRSIICDNYTFFGLVQNFMKHEIPSPKHATAAGSLPSN